MHTFRKHGDLLDGALLLHVGPEEVCHGGIPPLPRLQAGQVCFVGQVQGHVGEQKNECLWCNCWRLWYTCCWWWQITSTSSTCQRSFTPMAGTTAYAKPRHLTNSSWTILQVLGCWHCLFALECQHTIFLAISSFDFSSQPWAVRNIYAAGARSTPHTFFMANIVLKHNFCFDVKGRFGTTWMVTLYALYSKT